MEYIETKPEDEKISVIKIRVDGLKEKEKEDIVKVLKGKMLPKDLVISDFDKTQVVKTTEKIYKHICYHDIGGKSCEVEQL